ncbi:Rossmann-like and DUF2520 domain-containing protein [Thermoflavifilum thermophilum]|uniref:Predicted oxidoreductase, contains short-chain dehydrogenase (SDR) and DUF2520 domains n=1 Tax=Thermoflavifilum thermophilum TaxID=1393122 RepID=A0A1I7NLS2_9BACT|nr:Rossmann-like and DUF2520 domain-containing protein [Thermoflavifilum thermophilum]SFV35578.1 Predicted oxidoreductase, contains short-chain dehydrogenase (SDR) and DUF2520 domains [Thermoflavifilum thermophilum]
MRLVIIGSGNIAHFFASCWSGSHQIIRIISRNPAHASALAHAFQASYGTHFDEIPPDADACILAVNDDTLTEIAAKLRLSHQLVVHTSGSVSMKVLQEISSHYGVIYPLQTIRTGIPVRHAFPVLIEASNPEARQLIRLLAAHISNNILEIDSAKRKQYHLAAVYTNNFVYYLLSQVKWFCETHQLAFDLLMPLLHETITKIVDDPPFSQQTGPAKRNDQQTIQMHEQMLADHPALLELYRVFTDQIRKLYSDA